MGNVFDIRTGQARLPVEAGRIVVTGSTKEIIVRIRLSAGGRPITHKYDSYDRAMKYARGCAMQHGYSLADLVGEFRPGGDAA